jgi:hypothetical protein
MRDGVNQKPRRKADKQSDGGGDGVGSGFDSFDGRADDAAFHRTTCTLMEAWLVPAMHHAISHAWSLDGKMPVTTLAVVGVLTFM